MAFFSFLIDDPQASGAPVLDDLMSFIKRKDIDAVRRHFDDMLVYNYYESARPQWRHLKEAVLLEDRDMARLLIAFGATPAPSDLQQLQEMDHSLFQARQLFLRYAGYVTPRFRQAAQPLKNDMNAKNISFATSHCNKPLPQQWLDVLDAFQKLGASEAVIAGGALRDTFNDKPVKDIDIFMLGRGSTSDNKALINDAFAMANQKIQLIEKYSGYSISTHFPSPEKSSTSFIKENSAARDVPKEAWAFKAGEIEYNIVFLDKAAYQREVGNKSLSFAYVLRQSFDIGICQITCDGRQIAMSAQYIKDAENRRLTLCGETTKDHLDRIVKKYDGWTQDDTIKRALAKPAVKTSYYGGITSFY